MRFKGINGQGSFIRIRVETMSLDNRSFHGHLSGFYCEYYAGRLDDVRRTGNQRSITNPFAGLVENHEQLYAQFIEENPPWPKCSTSKQMTVKYHHT